MATYKLYASLSPIGATFAFTFSGADKDAYKTSASTSSRLELKAVDRGGTEVCFPANKDISILSARLLSGVPGVVAGDREAANITLIFGTEDSCALDDNLVEVPISFVEWNHTEKQSKSISSSLLAATEPLYMFMKSGSTINVCDYNIQKDWVGQSFEPAIELIIETESLLTLDGKAVH